MGELALFISWQALLLAAVTSVVMEGVKRGIDLLWKKRKESHWMTRLGMPVINGALGFVAGILVPFRPDAVVAYVTEHGGGWLAYGVWGVIVGGICGDFLYTKLKKIVQR